MAPIQAPFKVNRYPKPLQILHWLIAVLIGAQFALILVFKQLQSLSLGETVLGLHRQCGALVLFLIFIRLAVGLRFRAPKADHGFPAWQTLIAHGVHLALMAALAAQPILGFLMAWSRGDKVVLFGVLKLPTLVVLSNSQGVALNAWHGRLAYAMLGLLAVHIGAVVFNRIARKVSVIERMLPEPPSGRLVNRIPLTVQLSLCCGAILAMTLAAGLYGAGQFKTFNDLRSKFDDTEVAALDDMRSAQLQVKGLATDPTQAAAAQATVGAFPGRLTDPTAKAAATASAAALAGIAGGDHSPALSATAEAKLQEAVDAQYMAVFQKRLDIAEIASKGHDMIVLTLAPTVILSAILAFLLSRSILSALGRASGVVRRVQQGVADGDLSVEGGGEFANLMRDILRMRDSVTERQAQDHAIQTEQRAEMERLARDQREREAEVMRQQAEDQAQIVDALAGGLSALAAGDLTARLSKPFPGQYDQLRGDFNDAIVRLEATVRTIAEASHAIGGGSAEITGAAGNLSARTEIQATSLERTANALGEITATVKKSAASADQAAHLVASAMSEADKSTEIVSEAIRAMGDIESSSNQINQIIGVIDEIAFQTNLLALNAGIEAARAGQSGLGFAVVAQEVRALAQRSAEAAKEIKVLISASTQQVGAGVELVGQTGDVLRRIVGRVGEIDGLVSDIASRARDQAAGLDQVNTAVMQMDAAVQQNAAMAEETTAAVLELDGSVDALGGLIRQFAVNGGEPVSQRDTAPARRRA